MKHLMLVLLLASCQPAYAGIRASIEPAVVRAQVAVFGHAEGELTEVEQLRQDVDRHTTLMIQGGAIAIGVVMDIGSTEACVSEFPTVCAEANDWGWMQTNGTGRVMMQLGGAVVIVGANSILIRKGHEWASWANTGVFVAYKFYLWGHNTDVLNDLRAQYPNGDPGRGVSAAAKTVIPVTSSFGVALGADSIGLGVSW